jgi:thymidine phosphorylase
MAPQDLRNKALLLPRALLTWYMVQKKKSGLQLAKEILSSGEAYKKFLLCKAHMVLGNLNAL